MTRREDAKQAPSSPFTRYVVLDSSGNILRKGTCRPTDLGLQAREGELAREFDHVVTPVDDNWHRIDSSGRRVDKFTPEELEALRQQAEEERQRRVGRRRKAVAALKQVADPAVAEILALLLNQPEPETKPEPNPDPPPPPEDEPTRGH